jgi:hypothetical protein
MSAIEYGSYYWCVLLAGDQEKPGDSIYLHADEVTIDGGSLVFKSMGRRPAGTDPKSGGSDPGSDKGNEKAKDGPNKNMIYMAFAPGAWKMVYAAKLQDGSPASLEHWNKVEAGHQQPNGAPANAGASGYVSQGIL